MELKQIREILAERKWKIDTSVDKDGLNPDLVLRYLEDFSREDIDALRVYLKTYTSADNAAASETVTDPMKGTQGHRSGTWYGGQVYLKEVPRDSGPGKVLRLYQELFAGETTVGTVVVENGCRYVVEIYETFFGKTTLPTVPASTSGVSYRIEAFRVDEKHKTYSGYVEKRTRVAQDVAEYVSEVSAAQSVATTEKLGTTDAAALPIVEATGKINRRRVTKNDDCTVDVKKDSITPKDQTIIEKEESAAKSVSRETHTEASAALAEPSQTDGQINRVSNQETEAGNVRTTAETITPKDQTITEKEECAARSVERTTHTEATSPLPDPTDVAGEINRVSNQETEAGNVRTTAEKIIPKDQTIEETEESAARSVARTTHTEADTELTPATEETGKIKRVVNQETEAGNVKTTEETITPKDQTIIEKEECAARSVERTTHTEATSPLPDPTDVAGEINRVSNQETEAGNVKTTEETITPKDQTIIEKEESAARSVERTTHTEAEEELEPPIEEAGIIQRVINQETEAGNVRTTAEKITPKDQTIEETEESAERNVVRETHTEAVEPLANPGRANGIIVRVVNQQTEAGNYKTTQETITQNDQTATNLTKSALETIEEALHTSGVELLEETLDDGTTLELVNKPTESGKYETIRRQKKGIYVYVDITYPDKYGNSYYGNGRNATQEEFAAAIAAAALTNLSNNTVTVRQSIYKGLVDFEIFKAAQNSELKTTFYGDLGTWSKELYQREKRSDSSDETGYKWRLVTIHITDIWGTINACWNGISGGDWDSKRPEQVGTVLGVMQYHATKIIREFADWQAGSTDIST